MLSLDISVCLIHLGATQLSSSKESCVSYLLFASCWVHIVVDQANKLSVCTSYYKCLRIIEYTTEWRVMPVIAFRYVT